MLNLKELQFKEYDFNVRINNGKKEIFDIIRRKWIKITPEEWVRQHIVRWLQDQRKVPFSHISIEAGIKVNKLNKRTDIIVYDKDMKPEILVECKAPEVQLDEAVVIQALNYNKTVGAKFIMITNGSSYEIITTLQNTETEE